MVGVDFRAPEGTAKCAGRLMAPMRPAAFGEPEDPDGLQDVAPGYAARSAFQ